MTKHIRYHKNYTGFGEPYQLVLPLNSVPTDCQEAEMEAVGIGDASGYEKADYKIQKFEELLKIAGIE